MEYFVLYHIKRVHMLPVKEHLKHPSPRSNFICPFNVKTFINLKHLCLRESQRSL